MASNVEIKARAKDFTRQRELAEAMSDTAAEHMFQEDVFFNVPDGRLKLRSSGDSAGELIYYERGDVSGPRMSRYFIGRTEDRSSLKRVLSSSLGVYGLVRKYRTLFRVGDIRVHLDRVEDLGDFIELEYVMRDDTVEGDAVRAVRDLMTRLCIRERDLIDVAYIDLVLAGRPGTPR
ncbi:MAG: class IV adenylate cyclase [Candidatus Eiseniibacteriota bacterium]|nr:MAG: class IV adenylate cyclase [Candidatus Eisenbacteria bacterium]